MPLPLPDLGVSPVPMGMGPASLDVDTPVQDNGAIYLQVALYLSTWSQAYPGACDPPDFGELPDDFAGKGGVRTTRAIASFQRWAKARGATTLRTDGALDPATFLLLQRVAGDAAAAHLGGSPAVPPAARNAVSPPAQQSGVPWWGWAAGAGLLFMLFRKELGL